MSPPPRFCTGAPASHQSSDALSLDNPPQGGGAKAEERAKPAPPGVTHRGLAR